MTESPLGRSNGIEESHYWHHWDVHLTFPVGQKNLENHHFKQQGCSPSTSPVSVLLLFLSAGPFTFLEVCWRKGSKALTGTFNYSSFIFHIIQKFDHQNVWNNEYKIVVENNFTSHSSSARWFIKISSCLFKTIHLSFHAVRSNMYGNSFTQYSAYIPVDFLSTLMQLITLCL